MPTAPAVRIGHLVEGLLPIALLALLSGCRCDAPPAPEEMVRDQLFFYGPGEQPVLWVLVLQRVHRGDSASVEAKAFGATPTRLQTPFWHPVSLPLEPDASLEAVVGAWQASDAVRTVRLSTGPGIRLGARTPGAELAIALDPVDAAHGTGPHGPLTWRTGPAIASWGGRERAGVAIVEHLDHGLARPDFGSFEMWVLGTPDALVLGRTGAFEQSLRVDLEGHATVGPFTATPTSTRSHGPFALPDSWMTDQGALSRVEGTVSEGQTSDGDPAVYDIGLASGEGRFALVFHLQD